MFEIRGRFKGTIDQLEFKYPYVDEAEVQEASITVNAGCIEIIDDREGCVLKIEAPFRIVDVKGKISVKALKKISTVIDPKDFIVETWPDGLAKAGVKVMHKPTGIVSYCSEFRSPYKNIKRARDNLVKRLMDRERERTKEMEMNTNTIRPRNDNVVVLTEERTRTQGGITIPESMRRQNFGEVQAIGPDVKDICPGDEVLFQPYSGFEPFLNDLSEQKEDEDGVVRKLLVLQQRDIFAVVLTPEQGAEEEMLRDEAKE